MRIVSGKGVASAKFRTIAAGVGGPVMQNALEAGALIGVSAARDNVKGHGMVNSGDFMRRIDVMSATPRKAVYGTDHPGAKLQEFGGTVVPKKAKVLHFFVNGEEVFARKVTVPARPYMRPSADQNQAEIQIAIGSAIRAQLEAIA